MEIGLQGVERRTAHQMVRDALRRAILEGSLRGGTRLVQSEIAARLQVSTTPVREALRDLATEGLIHLDAHRGAVVRETSLDEVLEIYDLRLLLEPEAVRRAAERIEADQLTALEGLQRRMDEELDPVQWVQLNRDFHRGLVGASRSRRLAGTLQHLEDVAAVYVGLALRAAGDHFARGNADHHELIEACRRRDGDAAAAIIRRHLQDTLRILQDAESVLQLDERPGA